MVLMYHRVLPRAQAEKRAVEPGMYVSPDTFAQHVAWLDEYFAVLPLHEIVARLRSRRPLPGGACAITFDDGWRDNLEHALPVLRARGLSATVFAVTNRVGTLGAFWPDEVSRRMSGLEVEQLRGLCRELGVAPHHESIHGALTHLKRISEKDRPSLLARIRACSTDPRGESRELLDWQELAELTRHGVEVEAHGASHAILTGVPRSVVQRELAGALETLRAHDLGRHALFAYPSGCFDADIAGLARETGYLGAVTTQLGLAAFDTHPLALPRIGLHQDISSTEPEFLRWLPGSARPLAGLAIP